ncbi:MAG: outer membrane lipoprotein-sorting protein [Desulfobacterales bacterium]|nr:outer membrane lipoprotein-sorting protein [Desulfobacterales bacterium]
MKRKAINSAFSRFNEYQVAYLLHKAQDANDILEKMDALMYSPKDMTVKIKIILIDKTEKKKYAKQLFSEKETITAFRFTSPASQAGIAVLSLPDDVMYLYLPAFGKERRIATSAKNREFCRYRFFL